MSQVELNFTREEYAERLEKTKKAMVEKGLDLLIVTDPSNMAWLTGYDGWSFYVHQCGCVMELCIGQMGLQLRIASGREIVVVHFHADIARAPIAIVDHLAQVIHRVMGG